MILLYLRNKSKKTKKLNKSSGDFNKIIEIQNI